MLPFVPREKRLIPTSPVKIPPTGESSPTGLAGVIFNKARGKLTILT